MKCAKESLLLYAVTDRGWLHGQTLAEQVEAAVRGGATFVQLREKDMGTEEYFREAEEIRDLCHRLNVPFVIDDNVEVALRTGADGVHVGQHDMEAGDVRTLLGPDKILGVSVQTVEQAVLAEEKGANYLGVGAVFPTGSKADAEEVDLKTLQAICSAVSIPVVAIGGINAGNVLQLKGTGIAGIAVISALFAAPDPFAAAKELAALSREVVDS